MQSAYDKLNNCYKNLRKYTSFVPKVAIVLGSGLGEFADTIKIESELSYDKLEGFPVSTVKGHDGKFIFGYLGDIPVVCMKGRVHYYEGYDMQDVVLPTRLMKMMGAQILFLTNASGGISENLKAGDLMLITDQISCFVPSPLMGTNLDELGPRFPDMSEVYHKGLNDVIRKTAQDMNIDLKEGVYTQLTGPAYESPAEIKMLKIFGSDAVGMSTVVEAVAANHMGMKICGISCVCNKAAGLSDTPLSHEEVQKAADAASEKFRVIVKESVLQFGGFLHE